MRIDCGPEPTSGPPRSPPPMTAHATEEQLNTQPGDRDSARQRLSTQQMLHLMRLEAERALKHGYPISCLVMGLDTPENSANDDFQKIAMPLLFKELKSVSFARDVRGLGIWTEALVVGVFPHVDPEALVELAEGLVRSVRNIDSLEVPEDLELTASIGISHNLHSGEKSFEILVEEAETGMALARSGGGDRVTQAREVERELDRLQEAVEQQLAEITQFQEKAFGDVEDRDEIWANQLIDKVIDLFRRESEKSEGLFRVEKEVIALLQYEIGVWRESSDGKEVVEAHSTIENLERRVTKLTDSLGLTETELVRVARMKNIDLGVASIYGSVQGLKSGSEDFEQKKEMLKNLFEANLTLREETASR